MIWFALSVTVKNACTLATSAPAASAAAIPARQRPALVHGEKADDCADEHHPLEPEVDDARALGNDLAERGENERGSAAATAAVRRVVRVWTAPPPGQSRAGGSREGERGSTGSSVAPRAGEPASAQNRMIPWSSSTNACGTPSACSAKAPTMKPPKRNATTSVPARFAAGERGDHDRHVPVSGADALPQAAERGRHLDHAGDPRQGPCRRA